MMKDFKKAFCRSGLFGKIRKGLLLKHIHWIVPVVLLIVGYCLIPLPDPLFKNDYSKVIYDKQGRILRVFLSRKQQWHFAPSDSLIIPDKLKKAVLHYEDRFFYSHVGVNPVSVLRAVLQNVRSKKVVSGASTITMQVARLMQPKQRSVINKLLEIFQAFKIEIQYSKDNILKLYLDHAPYGGNIVGYQAASYRYFQKKPEQLTWSESAVLAVLPNAPGLISPDFQSEKLKQKRNRILWSLFRNKLINRESYHLSVLEPIPEKSTPFDFHAPHLARCLSQDQSIHVNNIFTTIDKSIQCQIEDLVTEHVNYHKRYGIHNGAAIAVENVSGKVRAYVGSQEFFDPASQGQVDGVRAPRSSGSLLKPFLYALCMDEGFLLPETQIRDVPSFYGAYSPANATENYDGIVRANQALVRSLNVPAVRLLYSYGVPAFYLFLTEAGLTTLFRSADEYGLPLILGGSEVTLWDMAILYRGLAQYGEFGPLRILESEKTELTSKSSVKKLIRTGSCYLTLEMLRELKRPGAEYYWEQYENQWPLAWKTGTSYGYRDAWAVGVSPQWTICVWIGNFNGESNNTLIGSKCAGPLLFDIYNVLPKAGENRWFLPPENALEPVALCMATGYLAGPDCPDTILSKAPSFVRPLKMCPYHHSFYVTENEKHQVCSRCWSSGEYKKVQRLVYSPEVSQYLRERGYRVTDIPPHNESCTVHNNDFLIKMIYPQDNARLWVPRDFNGQIQKVTVRAAHSRSDKTLYWYLDDAYLGKSVDMHTKAVYLSKGSHCIEVVDDTGNRANVTFYADMQFE